MLFISRFEASLVRSGMLDGYMANGGKVGLIDAGQRDILYQTGTDLTGGPMRRAQEVISAARRRSPIRSACHVRGLCPCLAMRANSR